MRRARGPLLALLLLGASLGTATAQEPPSPEQEDTCREPKLALMRTPDVFAPGGSYTLQFAIENPNTAPVESVRTQVTTTAPAGWSVTVGQRDLTLGPNEVTFNGLTITAPNRGSGAAAGNITLLVTFVCTTGSTQSSASASETIPVALRALQPPWPLVLGAFLALAASVAILGIRRLRRGVAIVPTVGARDIQPGKSAKYTFVVENRRGKPQRMHLLATGLPEGWSIHLALQDVELEPGEEKTMWAILKAPPHAAPGDRIELQLRLENEEGGRDRASAPLHARVVEAD